MQSKLVTGPLTLPPRHGHKTLHRKPLEHCNVTPPRKYEPRHPSQRNYCSTAMCLLLNFGLCNESEKFILKTEADSSQHLLTEELPANTLKPSGLLRRQPGSKDAVGSDGGKRDAAGLRLLELFPFCCITLLNCKPSDFLQSFFQVLSGSMRPWLPSCLMAPEWLGGGIRTVGLATMAPLHRSIRLNPKT